MIRPIHASNNPSLNIISDVIKEYGVSHRDEIVQAIASCVVSYVNVGDTAYIVTRITNFVETLAVSDWDTNVVYYEFTDITGRYIAKTKWNKIIQQAADELTLLRSMIRRDVLEWKDAVDI